MFKKVIYIVVFCCIVFSTQAKDLSDSYKELIELFNTDDYDATKISALSLLDEAKETNDFITMCKLYYLLGYISEYDDDFGMAIIYYLEGSRYGQLSPDHNIKKTVVSIHKNLASLLGDYKHYDLAYKFIDEAIAIASASQLNDQVMSLLNNKIHEYVDQEKYQEALHLIDSMRLAFPNLPKERMVKLYNKEGACYHNLGELDKALNSYYKAIDNNSAVGLDVQAISSQNIATILQQKGDFRQAINIFKESVAYCEKHEFDRWKFEGYRKLGEVYEDLNEIDSALYYYLEAKNLIGFGDQDADAYEILQLISQIYSKKNKYKIALEYKELYSSNLEEYIRVQNKITEDNQKYNIQLLTDRYFDLLAADKDQKDTERMAKFGISGTALIFLSILLAMLYRQRKTKQSLARELNLLELESDV